MVVYACTSVRLVVVYYRLAVLAQTYTRLHFSDHAKLVLVHDNNSHIAKLNLTCVPSESTHLSDNVAQYVTEGGI